MPTKERRLKKEAIETCTNRGHKMSRFYSAKYHPHYFAKCYNCLMEVMVDTHPEPNEIDISGEAVALNCNDPYLPKEIKEVSK
jgi:hypothetical protein